MSIARRCRGGGLAYLRHHCPPPIRLTAAQRGYGAAWRVIRAEHLRMEPDCRVCGRPATDVDHVRSRANGGSDAHANLRSMCHECHAAKTAREDGGFGNRRLGALTTRKSI